MTRARKLLGLVAVIGSAAPAAAQYAPPRPAPQGPTRLVFPAPPWITNGPRTGTPTGPGVVSQPGPMPGMNVTPTAPRTPQTLPAAPMPGTVTPAIPAIPTAPSTGVTPASATGPRATTVTRPDVWRPSTATVPGTVVPAAPKRK